MAYKFYGPKEEVTFMTQKILVGKPTQTDEELYELAIDLDCCAYYKGIPPCYKTIAEEEGWVLPHVYEEPC